LPVKEIENLYVKSSKFNNLKGNEMAKKLGDIEAELIDMSIEFIPTGSLTLTIRGIDVKYNKRKEEFTIGKRSIAAPAIDGKVKLRLLLDRASIELFANDGAAVATSYAVPASDNKSILISDADDMKINSIIINELKSSWK
jgi:sucrose-6-phosphate hydrolase SacC (GH32 family)